jgi:hypothetical protein
MALDVDVVQSEGKLVVVPHLLMKPISVHDILSLRGSEQLDLSRSDIVGLSREITLREGEADRENYYFKDDFHSGIYYHQKKL